MNLQNFICRFEEGYMQLLKEKISLAQHLTEAQIIDKKMEKAGFNIYDRSNAHSEGVRNAIKHFKGEASN